jgi:hypothetical protein
MFIHLPPWFKAKHPEIVRNMRINKNRLATPFDLHMTLKHILELSGRVENLPQAISCPTAQSLFKEIPFDRDCDDACISSHDCACDGFIPVEKNEAELVMKMIMFSIEHMNAELDEKAIVNETLLCHKIKFKEVMSAFKSDVKKAGTEEEHMKFLLKFKTTGTDGTFETTIESYEENSKFIISGGDLSRLDYYGDSSYCVRPIDAVLLKYCHCIIPKPEDE